MQSLVTNQRRQNQWCAIQQQRLDEVRVVNLRAYASRLWARYPNMSEDAVKHAMSEECERTGCTVRELRAACLNLQFVRDDYDRGQEIERLIERAR